MKKLTRYEMAAVKKTAAITRPMRVKLVKLNQKIKDLEAQKAEIQATIDVWESPIMQMTDGLTSEDVINNTILEKNEEIVADMQAIQNPDELDGDAKAPEVETGDALHHLGIEY